jgi:uncharacterized small protein (DUF1192 family)
MTDDELVARLRKYAKMKSMQTERPHMVEVMTEAADRIEALTDENERLKAEVQELMDELAYHGIYPNDLTATEKQPVVRKARYFNRYLTDAEVDEQVAQMRSEK